MLVAYAVTCFHTGMYLRQLKYPFVSLIQQFQKIVYLPYAVHLTELSCNQWLCLHGAGCNKATTNMFLCTLPMSTCQIASRNWLLCRVTPQDWQTVLISMLIHHVVPLTSCNSKSYMEVHLSYILVWQRGCSCRFVPELIFCLGNRLNISKWIDICMLVTQATVSHASD